MTETSMDRRALMEMGGKVVATALVAGAVTKDAYGQVDTAPRASGQDMPEGVALPAPMRRQPRPNSVGFAVVGLGSYALNQMMPRFASTERAHVAAIVSGNPDKLRRVGDAYGVAPDARYSYADFARLGGDRRVDAVYVALPTGLHAEWAIRAFAAGKHVLCEKPMALSSADCERMIAAGRRAGRKLMVAYRSHFEPYNVEAMRLMRERAVGNIRLVRTEQSYRMGPADPASNWRTSRALAGGGPLEDYGIYGLQSALYLTGEMPERISATAFRPGGDPRFSEIYAHVASQWRFPSGAVAQLVTSYDSAGINFAEVRGTEGVLTMNPATSYSGQTMQLKGSDDTSLTPGDPTVQFGAQLDHFAAAIRDGTPIRTPGEMGLRDLRLIEAIYAAARDGSSVRLAPDGRMLT